MRAQSDVEVDLAVIMIHPNMRRLRPSPEFSDTTLP